MAPQTNTLTTVTPPGTVKVAKTHGAVKVEDAFQAAAAAGPRASGVYVDVPVTAAERVLLGVSDSVGGGRHATYATELHSPACRPPPTQQSQQGEPDAGHRPQSYCADATRASSAAAVRARPAV
jgi:hypothetical protein